MKRKLGVAQGTVLRLLKQAEAAAQAHDVAQAVELATRAQRLDPADVGILLFLGQLHLRNLEAGRAEEVFERAGRLSARPAETLLQAGRHACAAGQWELGRRFLERAAARPEASAETLAALAGALERLRRTAEALELTARALGKDAGCGEALLVRARLLRQGGQLEEAEALLRENRERMDRVTRAKAGYELGQIYDREGRYDEAMAAWQEAKALLLPDAKPHAYQLRVMRERLRRLREGLSAERLAAWRAAAGELAPARRVALLGGHPRSGTTLLEQVVDAHPEVVSAEETELFHDDAYLVVARGAANEEDMLGILAGADTARLRQARENYFVRAGKFLGQAVGARLLLDKNPSVTFLVGAFVRVFPEARFLIALRDPRDVCLSCFMQSVPLNQASSAWLSLEGTVEEYGELMRMWLTLKPWLEGQALEVRYEEMVEDLPAVARRTLEFLGLAWDERVLGFDAHARQKAVRSPTYADVTRPVFKTAVGRWRNYQKYFEPHLAALEPFVQALGYG